MKKIIVPVIMAFAATAASAQQGTTPAIPAAPIAPTEARIVAELAAAQGGTSMKNSPVSFDEINESVQTLADGNRITRSSTGKFYRNSEGRIRREVAGGTGGVFGSVYTTGQNVSILNPTIGQKYLLDSELKTARVLELTAAQRELAVTDAKRAAEVRALTGVGAATAGTDLAAKLRTELKATTVQGMAVPEALTVITPSVTTAVAGAMAPLHSQGVYFPSTTSKYETRTEELGTRDFEGVSAEGTRRTTTIPAGAIGNERPIEIVYERWYSKELGMVVYSKNTDPRFGEQTYRITNIQRAEPDPSLFSVPTGYKRVSADRPVYRMATPAKPAPTAVTVPVRSVSTSKIKQ
jgi:hypothetical protein